MKIVFSTLFMLLRLFSEGQTAKNIFVITIDGVRWQEIFEGADSATMNDARFVKDTALLKQLYWHKNAEERRKKLLPFFWNTIACKGQLYGNRNLNSKVNVKNLYNISYPGYNEIFTGYADPFILSNKASYNSNLNVLEFINAQPGFSGKVVAFSSWEVFPYILNNKRGSVLQESGYRLSLTDSTSIVKKIQDNVGHKASTRQDMLTFFSAKEYIRENHPRVVLISLGETDELAHAKQYDLYLQQVNRIDNMLAELWYYIQTDTYYKDQTNILITTDHGRGQKPDNWSRHTMFAKGSGHVWLALLGKNIEPIGEMAASQKIFQNQIAATIAQLVGESFESNRKVGKGILLSTAAPDNLVTDKRPLVFK